MSRLYRNNLLLTARSLTLSVLRALTFASRSLCHALHAYSCVTLNDFNSIE